MDITRILAVISDNMDQSQAAALAVICCDIRENLDEHLQKQPPEKAEQIASAIDLMTKIEQTAISSIDNNSGNSTRWIGTAAKQLSPLLANT